ncbi:MAG: TonB family protein [Flavobacteriales bacterium]|jgi:TonB family protein
MEFSLNNVVEVQAYLLLVVGIYNLVLKKLTFYTFNRYFLLLGGILSMSIPFFPHGVFSSKSVFSNTLPIVDVSQRWQEMVPSQISTIHHWFWIICWSISILLLLTTLIQTSRLLKGKKVVIDKLHYIVNNHKAAPFSLFKYIVVNQLPLEKEIAIHEKAHISQKHYLDLVLVQCIVWLNWFNPASWLLLRSVKNNHELLADRAVLSEGINKKNYQQLMVSQALSTPIPIFSNSFFNQSILKQRIMMMTKKQSNKKSLLKTLWMLPLALFIFVACSETAEVGAPALTNAEVMPEYKGGNEALFAYLGNNIEYPKSAANDSIEGIVYVSFIVNKKGKVTEPTIKKGIDARLDEVALKVISNMPNWSIGMDKGEPVSVIFNLPIRFTLN